MLQENAQTRLLEMFAAKIGCSVVEVKKRKEKEMEVIKVKQSGKGNRVETGETDRRTEAMEAMVTKMRRIVDGVEALVAGQQEIIAGIDGVVLSYDFPGSFRNGKYVENNSRQERTKSRTLPVTDKDLASTYVLCCVVPPITYLSLILDGERILLERSKEGGKTKSRFKTNYDKTSTRCLNKKS